MYSVSDDPVEGVSELLYNDMIIITATPRDSHSGVILNTEVLLILHGL